MEEPIWQPSPARIAESNLHAFMAMLESRAAGRLGGYAELHDYSIREPEAFWSAVWDFCGVVGETKGTTVLRDSERMPGAVWFPEARLNFAENMLRRRDDLEALVGLDESGRRRSISFTELYEAVSRTAQALAARGVAPGDRVAGLMANVPEAVVAMLATTSLGAVWCVCSPDFGVGAAIDRLGQVDPKVLFASADYSYNGKRYDCRDKVAEIASRIPTLKAVVVGEISASGSAIDGIPGALSWPDFLDRFPPREIPFPRFPFDHPAFILYSSGTTGTPKCILHGAGGTLLENLKGHALQFDVKRGDRIFWWTTTGWVVWNLMTVALACEATLILYDGSPVHPATDTIFTIASTEKATFLRLTPKLLDEVAKAGLAPIETHNLNPLTCITVGGAPLGASGYEFIYTKVKKDVQLASPAGGTDPMGALVTGNPISPVWPGEIQCRALGMKVEVFNEEGRPAVDGPGELVVTLPFPSMPLGHFNDPEGRRYSESYFGRFANVWCHGDWAELTPRGGVIIHGRSDATLNARGVRIGTAEIYRQVELLPEIQESVAVAHERNGETQVVLFLQLRHGAALTPALTARIEAQLRDNASPRHVPDLIVQVADIPRTATGKVSERAVLDAIHGRQVKNMNALANPDALALFSPLLVGGNAR